MANEKPPDNRDGNAFEKKKEKTVVCDSCKGTGKFEPPGAKRAAQCQKCKGKGFLVK
jgi:DnaJ-class molecular chaperone